MAKIIFAGGEDSGKSLMLATYAGQLVERNAQWADIIEKSTGERRVRPIRSNLHFTPWFEEYAQSLSVPIIYWKDIEEWPSFQGCDMICDEIGVYLDSRRYADLPQTIRFWLGQASKLGCDIYGSAQDFAQIDLAFRRLVKSDNGGLFEISKLIGSPRPHPSKPPVTKIWGVCLMKELDPIGYDENSKRFSSKQWFPRPFLINKFNCSIFDTNRRVQDSAPPPYKHIERRCSDPACNFRQYVTRDGHQHKVTHI